MHRLVAGVIEKDTKFIYLSEVLLVGLGYPQHEVLTNILPSL